MRRACLWVTVISIGAAIFLTAQSTRADVVTWIERIRAGTPMRVIFDQTKGKFDDSTYTGNWRTDPMGTLKGGEAYLLTFKDGAFTCTGLDQGLGRSYTKTTRNVSLDDSMLSLWGRGYTFDGKGRVWDPEYGLVGRLSEDHGGFAPNTPAATEDGGAPCSGPLVRNPLVPDDLRGRTFRFGRGDGTIIADGLRLIDGGVIEGYHHFNESEWGLMGGRVVFISGKGQVTTCFDDVSGRPGSLVLSGRFRDGRNGLIHILTEVGGQSTTGGEGLPDTAGVTSLSEEDRRSVEDLLINSTWYPWNGDRPDGSYGGCIGHGEKSIRSFYYEEGELKSYGRIIWGPDYAIGKDWLSAERRVEILSIDRIRVLRPSNRDDSAWGPYIGHIHRYPTGGGDTMTYILWYFPNGEFIRGQVANKCL